MSSKFLMLRVMALVAISAILVGCASPTAIIPTAVATLDLQPTLNAVKTQSAQTVVANLTQNAPTAAPATATSTPNPTATGTPVPTATIALPTSTSTATFIPWTLTPTVGAFSCVVTSVSPKTTDKLGPTADFDATWVIKNAGTQTWAHGEIDIAYVSGTKFQTGGDLMDMAADVTPGNTYTIAVDMKTPADAGTFTAVWTVSKGSDVLCTLNLTVNVVK